MSVDQTYFQICHAPASLEWCIMPWMRPSSTGCVLRAWDESGKFLMLLDCDDDFMSVNGGKMYLITNYVLVLNEWSPSKWWYMCRI
ncbi:hypothetical protein Hanom_Chr07g00677821 [Helianthus anomalus]